MTRVAVVGPGAIGATMAAMVMRAGAELVLCGRTPLERLVVEREGGVEAVLPGPVVTDPEAVPWRADVVLLCVKAHQTAAAAPFLRALSGERTTVVALQNGVEQRAQVAPHAPGATVLPAVVWFPAERVAADRVLLRGDPRITLPDEPAAHAVAELIPGIELAADFAAHAWRKLAINAVAGLMVLSGRRAAMFRHMMSSRSPARWPPSAWPSPAPRAPTCRTRSPTSWPRSSPPCPRTSAPRSSSTARPAARSSGTPATASWSGWAPTTASRRRSAT